MVIILQYLSLVVGRQICSSLASSLLECVGFKRSSNTPDARCDMNVLTKGSFVNVSFDKCCCMECNKFLNVLHIAMVKVVNCGNKEFKV